LAAARDRRAAPLLRAAVHLWPEFLRLVIPGSLPATFDDAIRWNGSRADIWGINSMSLNNSDVWQAYDLFSN
jgi:hypothetical protein